MNSVSQFAVKAKAENQWQAVGEGVVKINKPDQQTVIWEEAGQWDSTLNNLEFSNSYRWTLVDNNEIRLEHLRYGENQPVQLVDIHYQKDNSWTSIEPHLCGEDSYHLDLNVDENCLTLAWQIKGPKKNQFSTIRYR